MAGLNISLSLDGDVQFNRTLIGISDRADDMRGGFQAAADVIMEAEKRQFATQGAFGSGGWQPLAPATVAMKQALGLDNGILDRTGILRRSLSIKGSSGQVLVIAPHQFVFGTSVEYAGFHQNGRGVPTRKPLELPESTRKDIVKTIQRFWIEGRV